jgi:hypothetical protein
MIGPLHRNIVGQAIQHFRTMLERDGSVVDPGERLVKVARLIRRHLQLIAGDYRFLSDRS